MRRVSPPYVGLIMSSKKPPVKKTPMVDKPSTDEVVATDVDADEAAVERPSLDKVAIAKERYQPRFPNTRGYNKATKIGISPRGTRKSMGKR